MIEDGRLYGDFKQADEGQKHPGWRRTVIDTKTEMEDSTKLMSVFATYRLSPVFPRKNARSEYTCSMERNQGRMNHLSEGNRKRYRPRDPRHNSSSRFDVRTHTGERVLKAEKSVLGKAR